MRNRVRPRLYVFAKALRTSVKPIMPFNVQFGAHDEPALRRQQPRHTKNDSALGDFFRGISFGLGLVVVLFAAFWLLGPFAGVPSMDNVWATMSGWR